MSSSSSRQQTNDALGVDGAAEFAAMLKKASEQEANQDLARAKQSDKQAQALLEKLAKGKNSKQKALIEKAFKESGLVDQAVTAQQKKQDDELAARLAAGRKKKTAAVKAAVVNEEKYPEPSPTPSAAANATPKPAGDYLEQKYGEMLEEEQKAAAALKKGDKAQAVLENQSAIAAATTVGMKAGADGVEVAEIAARAAALGLTPDQITAAAGAAAAVSALGGAGEVDHTNFMELFRKATEDAAAEQVRLAAAQSNQDDAFMHKLLAGKKTKQQKMVDQQMAEILAAQEKAKSFAGDADAALAAKLAAGKNKKKEAADETARLAAESLASELESDTTEKTGLAKIQQDIEQILAAPTILDELLAVNQAQLEEIHRQSAETGIAEADIIAANSETLELDNMAAEVMLQNAREAEANGDVEGAAAFMDMYKRMIEEGLSKSTRVKRQLSDAEEMMMFKLMKGKTTKQQELIMKAFRNEALVDAIMNQEKARQDALMEAKIAAGKFEKQGEENVKLAEDAFTKLRKIFLGAIKKLDASNIIRQLTEIQSLVDEGFLDLNKPIKETGETMLHQAAKYGRNEVVEWLLKSGKAKPNARNNLGQSPVHFAALSLDPNGPDKVNQDAAATSCMVLIEHGGDVNQSDAAHETPLSIAAELGFDLTALAETPEARAALAAQKKAERKAAKMAGLQMQSETGIGMESETMSEEQAKAAAAIAADAAAKVAAKLSMEEETNLATQVIIDPATGLPMTQEQIQFQKQELENLMNEEKLEIIALAKPDSLDPKKTKAANLVFIQLCDLFKDINSSRNEFEAAALIKANADLIREGYLDLSKPVKGKGDGSSLLHAAVYHQKANLVRQLLQNRSDPNKTTMTGETPLHMACSLADREPNGKMIVNLLLEAGANSTLRDFKNGHTPFENAPTAALKQWMEEWKPLAERQRLALANQMGGLDALLEKTASNMKTSAMNAENSFLEKLMRGKLTKQGALLDAAFKANDRLNSKTLTEQQKQLEAMQARLAKGRAKRGGGVMMQDEALSLATGTSKSKESKKEEFMQNMLLQELSEATTDKIMLTAERWAEHPKGISGLDITVLTKLRGMPIAEAMKLLAQEIVKMEQEQIQLNQAINAPGLDEQQVQEYERQFNIADCNIDIYSDLTKNMLEAEKKRQESEALTSESNLSEEALAVARASERLAAIEAKKAAKAGSALLPQGVLEAVAQLFSQYIAVNTGYEIEPMLILQGALPMDDLKTYNLDTETIETMLSLQTDVDSAKLFLAKQTLVNDAVSENLKRLLLDENLPAQQREETEIHAKICGSNTELYDALINVMNNIEQFSHSKAGTAPTMHMEGDLNFDNQTTAEQMEMAAAMAAQQLDPDTGLRENVMLDDVMLTHMRELVAELLGVESSLLSELSQEELMAKLAAAGIQIDIMDELRKLSEAEAGKFLAKERAALQAESDMLRKLLNGKGLTAEKRAELLARQKVVDDAADLMNNLFSTLLTGEKKKYAHLSAEEQRAQDMLLAKLAARRKKEAKSVCPDTGLSMGERIQDVVLEQMRDLVADTLGMDAKEMANFSQDQLQQALASAGINIDILGELRKLTEAEAAKYLARDMARNEAESDMLRKILKGKNLSEKKRAELMARQKQLDDAADLYNDMLSTLLTGEQKKYSNMSAEEQRAQDRMLAKLAARRRKAEQAALEKRIQRQDEEVQLVQQMGSSDQLEKMGKEVMVLGADGQPVLDENGQPKMEMVYESSAAGTEMQASEVLAKQGVMHQLIADNPQVLACLESLAAEHLGLSAAELKNMNLEEVQMLLAEKGVDINILDYLKNLTNEEAAKHLAREMARAEAEAKMIRKLLQGKGLTPQQREDLLAKQKMLDDNAKMYEDMLRGLLNDEQRKYANMTAAEKAAYDAMQAKLALRKAQQVAKAKEATQVDENSELLQLFDDLSTKGPYECRVCQTLNEAVNRSCKFCKKSRAETLVLPEIVLWHAHRMVHQCSCPISVIEVVHRSIGPCTKRNFLQFMQATVIACDRDSHVYWDSCGVDAEGFGCLDSLSSELVWGFNDFDVENPRYHVFRDKHLDEVGQAYIGWTDFREECVQMPTIADYQ